VQDLPRSLLPSVEINEVCSALHLAETQLSVCLAMKLLFHMTMELPKFAVRFQSSHAALRAIFSSYPIVLLLSPHRITESQHGRGWKGPLWVTQPNPLLKQGLLQQAAQDHVQAGLEYLQRRRLHNLPGQPVPGLHQPQSEEVLPHVQVELPRLQFVPVAPCPVAGQHWKESGPVLLTPTLEIFIGISKVPCQHSLLQAEQAQLPQPFLIGQMLQSLHHPHSEAGCCKRNIHACPIPLCLPPLFFALPPNEINFITDFSDLAPK